MCRQTDTLHPPLFIALRYAQCCLLCCGVLWHAVLQNLCVGAPCGVMDQMTAALGEAGQLTALLCQPAELQAGVQIPPQVRWGCVSADGVHLSLKVESTRIIRVVVVGGWVGWGWGWGWGGVGWGGWQKQGEEAAASQVWRSEHLETEVRVGEVE